MDPQDETLVRLGITVDFLARLGKDHIFFYPNQTEQLTPFHYLCLASLFASAGDVLQNKWCIQYAQIMIDEILKNRFTQNKLSVIVKNNTSLTVWNALTAHILFKLSNEQAYDFCLTLKNSITNRVHKYFHTLGDQSAVTEHTGIVTLTLIEAFVKTQDEEYLDKAKQSTIMICQMQRLDVFDAWGVYAVYQHTKNSELIQHLRKMITTLDIDISVMTGLVIPVALQIYSIWTLVEPGKWLEKRIEQIQNLLFLHQVDTNHSYGYDTNFFQGAFVKEPEDPIIKLEYCSTGSFGLLQHLLFQQTKDLSLTM